MWNALYYNCFIDFLSLIFYLLLLVMKLCLLGIIEAMLIKCIISKSLTHTFTHLHIYRIGIDSNCCVYLCKISNPKGLHLEWVHAHDFKGVWTFGVLHYQKRAPPGSCFVTFVLKHSCHGKECMITLMFDPPDICIHYIDCNSDKKWDYLWHKRN